MEIEMKKFATPEIETRFREALCAPEYAYARARPICGALTIFVYEKDPKSPSGVLLSASFPDFEDGIKIMDEIGRPFPLSPTEGLRSSR
jgi:hypothetical protein